MATLQQLIEYSKKNPTSDIARRTQQQIQSGYFDMQAQKEGIDLSWAGRPKVIPQVEVQKQALIGSLSSVEEDSKPTLKEKSVEFRQDVIQGVKGLAGDVKKRVVAGAQAVKKGRIGGEITPLEGGVQMGAQVVGVVSDALGQAFKTVVKLGLSQEDEDALKQGIQNVSQAVGIDDAMMKYAEWAQNNPRLSKNAEAVGTIANFLLDVGGIGVAKKPIEKGVDTTIDITKQGVKQIGLEVSKIGSGLSSDVVSPLGRGISAIGGKAYQTTIKPSVYQAELELAYKANNPLSKRMINTLKGVVTEKPVLPSETAARKGIAGTETMVGVQAKRAADDLWKNKLDIEIKKSPAIMSKEELFSPIEKRISDTVDPAKRKAFEETYEAIKQDYTEFPEMFNLDQAQALKRGLDDFTPEKLFKGKNVASEYKVLANDMANAIRQKTYNALPEGSRMDFLDYGNLQVLEKVGIQAISEPIVKAGGFGTLVSHLWNIAAVPISTVSGKVLYKVGNALQFLGQKGEKTFGSHLMKKGFSTPDEFKSSISAGMSMKDITKTPASVAKLMDETDVKIIKKYLANPKNPTAALDAEAIIVGAKLDKADPDVVKRFLQDALDEYNGVANRDVLKGPFSKQHTK